MDPRVHAELARQRGLITRGQARAAGLDEREIAALLRDGTWVGVRHGVYTTAELWSTLDAYVGRPRLRARAAHLTMRVPHVLSHDSAAHELGLAILRPARELVHVTRPAHVIGSRTHYGVKHHGAPYRPEQVVDVGGIPVLDAARTAADIGRERGFRHGLVACDSAMRLGVSRSQLWDAVRPMRCWRGVRDVRRAVEMADGGAENPGETLARELVVELGIGDVETQFELRDHTGRARCDLRVGRHVFEFDGRVKYQRADEGGVAVTDAGEVVWREKQRQDWVCGFGLGMSRIVWDELWGERRRETTVRLLREYAATEARFGTSIADLGHVVVRKPGRPAA